MHIKDRSLLGLLLLLLLQAPFSVPRPLLAQSPNAPAGQLSRIEGQAVRIDGSGSMAAVNAALKQGFESQAQGAVTFAVNGTLPGLAALDAGKVDLAAIGRPLTDAEKAKGFVAIPIKREKIAMIIGTDNPYAGNMTIDQFAKLFRGEVKDWSEVGGAAGPVRFVDQPDGSDTRSALANYPTFKTAPFTNGSTTVKVNDEQVASLATALGKDGISYVTADQARNLPGTKIVVMHKTLPDDPRYPFSHPLNYVYKQGALTPAAKAFLGYVATPAGQTALKSVGLAQTLPIGTEVKEAIAGTSAVAAIPPSPVTAGTTSTAVPPASIAPTAAAATEAGFPGWLWPLMLLGGAGLLWAFLKRPRGGSSPVGWEDPVTRGSLRTESVDPAIDGAGDLVTPDLSDLADSPSVTQLPAEYRPENSAPTPPSQALVPEPPKALMVPSTPDLAPRAADTVGAAVAGTLGVAAIAQTFFAEDPTVDENPRQTSASLEVSTAPMAAPGTEMPSTEPTQSTPESSSPMTTESSNEQSSQQSGDNIEAPNIEAANIEAAIATGAALGGISALGNVDGDLTDLPGGYGDSRIVLMARDPQWAYAYWDVTNDHKEALRNQGGQQLALRLYDVTDVDLSRSRPHSVQQYGLEELTRDWYLPIPVSDRDYMAEIGYNTGNGDWLLLARSNAVRIPPVYPSDHTEEQMATVLWDEPLQDKVLPLPERPGTGPVTIHDQMFKLSAGGMVEHQAGSMPTSGMFTSGMGMGFPDNWMTPSGAGGAGLPGQMNMSGVGLNMSGVGLNMSGVGFDTFGSGLNMSGVGLTMSGVGMNMSGVGMNMSGVGLGIQPRNFWLVADAVLIVYGATEPDANLTIDGVPVKLNSDGTFRLQMSFQDGQLRFPIMAVAADGEQMRNITLNFDRQTPRRNTNTKDQAQDEWPT
jgi:ABC-type phosphate transport system substrate-binding protein